MFVCKQGVISTGDRLGRAGSSRTQNGIIWNLEEVNRTFSSQTPTPCLVAPQRWRSAVLVRCCRYIGYPTHSHRQFMVLSRQLSARFVLTKTQPNLIVQNIGQSRQVLLMTSRLVVLGKRTCITAFITVAMIQSAWAESVTLSGLHLFGLDAAGNLEIPTGGLYTYVPNGGNFDLWVTQGGISDPFINGPTRDNAGISVPLNPGSYTFSIFGASGCGEGQSIFPCASPQYGLNLFFNGNGDTPGISVMAATNYSATPPFPAFSANSGTTVNLSGSAQVAGAGTLVFTDGATSVTLTNFQWSVPMVYNLDRISNFTTSPDGSRDFVGQFALQVSTTRPLPEPSTLVLLASGLVGLLAGRRYLISPEGQPRI